MRLHRSLLLCHFAAWLLLSAVGCESESNDAARLLKQKQRAKASEAPTVTPEQRMADAQNAHPTVRPQAPRR